MVQKNLNWTKYLENQLSSMSQRMLTATLLIRARTSDQEWARLPEFLHEIQEKHDAETRRAGAIEALERLECSKKRHPDRVANGAGGTECIALDGRWDHSDWCPRCRALAALNGGKK